MLLVFVTFLNTLQLVKDSETTLLFLLLLLFVALLVLLFSFLLLPLLFSFFVFVFSFTRLIGIICFCTSAAPHQGCKDIEMESYEDEIRSKFSRTYFTHLLITFLTIKKNFKLLVKYRG